MGACPDKKAGTPKVPPSKSRSAATLEKESDRQEWVEDRNLGGLFRDIAVLDTDWHLKPADMVEWVEEHPEDEENTTSHKETQEITYANAMPTEDPMQGDKDPWIKADRAVMAASAAVRTTSTTA